MKDFTIYLIFFIFILLNIIVLNFKNEPLMIFRRSPMAFHRATRDCVKRCRL